MKLHDQHHAGKYAAAAMAVAILLALPRLSRAAAPAPPEPTADSALLHQLLDRVDRQDQEIGELKSELASRPASQPAGEQKQIDDLKAQMESLAVEQEGHQGFPSLQFHGFGDVDFVASNQKGAKNTFFLGEMDFFITSQLADDLNMLCETVVSGDPSNSDGIEVERWELQFTPSDYLHVDVGRFHTQFGYYNTAFHHGTWFQTATNRPFFDQFEDSGGVIPSHMVGISVNGRIPSGKLGLSYYVEIGNGRQYQSPTSDLNSVGNEADENNYKSINLALVSRPETVPGLEVGAGLYMDRLTPTGMHRVDENLLNAHVVYKNSDWEFLSELYALNHSSHGVSNWSPAFFVQLARKFGAYTPYARFAYFDASNGDPIYQLLADTGRHYGPSFGVRYDVSTFVALKMQYDYFVNSQSGYQLTLPFSTVKSGSYSELEFQISFTF